MISSARLRMEFKEYRREYKKRFARINAGRLTKSAFYAWSEEARKKKEDCDGGVISPEEFSYWLKESRERGAAIGRRWFRRCSPILLMVHPPPAFERGTSPKSRVQRRRCRKECISS